MGATISVQDGKVTITWDDPRDALEAGSVLRSAGISSDGSVCDRGFYEDGNALIEAADSLLAQADDH
jgi:hypothetical protein